VDQREGLKEWVDDGGKDGAAINVSFAFPTCL